MKSIFKANIPLLGTLLMIVLSTACNQSSDAFVGTEMAASMPTSDFSLPDQDGERFVLSEQEGYVVLMFFGYTSCPDVCPLTLSTWRKVQEQLGEEAEKVKFVYITVDPDRDTPEKLAEHLEIFSDDFIGLTGDKKELVEVYQNYGIIRERVDISESATGYLINHTSRVYMIDKSGHWRLAVSHDAPPEDMVHDIRILLNEAQSTAS